MAKYSKQRERILQAVLENKDHPTADWVYHKLKPEHPGLSLGTVYRNLNLLVETGVLRKVSLPGEADRFDGEDPRHIHFRCRSCGALYDLRGEAAEEAARLSEKVRQLTGHEPRENGLVLEGTCSRCREKEIDCGSRSSGKEPAGPAVDV